MGEVWLILVMTAIACSLLGVFILLQNLSMLIDALSHSLLLGIVIAFWFVKDVFSVWLMIGASIFGVIALLLMQWLGNKKVVKHQDAIGIVYPIFFSLAIVLITKFFRNAHLDVDMVLLGNPLFAPFVRWGAFSKSFVMMFVMTCINGLFVWTHFKSLKMMTFDREFALTVNVPVVRINAMLVVLTAFTSIGGFDSVGSILVIAWFVTPAAIAYLLAQSLSQMVWIAIGSGVIIATIGFLLSVGLNVSISGMCSFVGLLGVIACVLIKRRTSAA